MKEAIQKEIVTWFNAAYVAAYPAIPVVYENQPFDWNNLSRTSRTTIRWACGARWPMPRLACPRCGTWRWATSCRARCAPGASRRRGWTTAGRDWTWSACNLCRSTATPATGPQRAADWGLTAYDACYLDTALQQRLPLATKDRLLAETARRIGVPLYQPTLRESSR